MEKQAAKLVPSLVLNKILMFNRNHYNVSLCDAQEIEHDRYIVSCYRYRRTLWFLSHNSTSGSVLFLLYHSGMPRYNSYKLLLSPPLCIKFNLTNKRKTENSKKNLLAHQDRKLGSGDSFLLVSCDYAAERWRVEASALMRVRAEVIEDESGSKATL